MSTPCAGQPAHETQAIFPTTLLPMKRRDLIKALGAAPLTGVVSAAANGAKPGGQGLYRVSGSVLVNGKPAKEGSPVRAGDTVVTGPGSEAVFVVGQDAYRMRGDSRVSLIGDTLKSGLRVLSGGLLSVFGRGEKQIFTPSATIGIRGTGCYIEASPERVYFCLCYGTAQVVPSAAPEQAETITTTHHDHPLYILPDGRRSMVPAGVANHGDAELVELESLVGRTPPFQGLVPSAY